MKRILVAVGLCLAVAAPVYAKQAPKRPVTMTIDVSANDLSSESKARKVYRTLKIRANRACRTRSGLRTLGYTLDLECRDTLVDKAIAALDAPMLTALHVPALEQPTLAARSR